MSRRREQRTILIFALAAIALIMVVGFAAFSTSLQINGTANISTNWCVGFDNTKTNTYQITKGRSTGTSPTATMGYDGTACSSTYVPIANLGAVFYQPGDKVEYTLTIANKGSIDAVIESITVDGDSVTSDQTITKGNIIWKVYMPASTTLQATTGTTTMVVSAEFQNDTDLVSYDAHETQTIAVGINAVQSTGSNAMTVTPATFSGTIYRNNTTRASIGDLIVAGTQQLWVVTNGSQVISGFGPFGTQSECQAKLTEVGAPSGIYCDQQAVTGTGVGQYTTSASSLNKSYYLKHTVSNNVITESYVCFVTDQEHCMIGGEDHTGNNLNYLANKALLEGQESWFTNHGGECDFSSGESGCWNDEFFDIYAQESGHVVAEVSKNVGCFIDMYGYSYCSQYQESQKVYAKNTNTVTINTSTLQDVGTTYNSCAATGENECLRYTIENNKVTGAEVCFVKGGSEYCLTGGDSGNAYSTNKSLLLGAFGSNQCTGDTSLAYNYNNDPIIEKSKNGDKIYIIKNKQYLAVTQSLSCELSDLHAVADQIGYARAYETSWDCEVKSDGSSKCWSKGVQ